MKLLLKKYLKRLNQYYYYRKGMNYTKYSDPTLIILMYHRVLPKSDPRYLLEQPGMIVEPDTFSLHLKLLKDNFKITSIQQWLDCPEHDRPRGISFAISFDDGWSDNFTYAYPMLKAAQVPATIFLVSDMIDTNATFWPERLANILLTASNISDSGIYNHDAWDWLKDLNPGIDLQNCIHDRECLDKTVTNCKKLGDHEINNRLDLLANVLPEDSFHISDILSWEQINKMKSDGLVDFGSHTKTHARMNKLSSDNLLVNEIVDSKEALEKSIGLPVKLFCYPNGDTTKESDALVRKTYKAAVTTKPGLNTSSDDYYLLRRIGIHQDESYDELAFFARIYRLISK